MYNKQWSRQSDSLSTETNQLHQLKLGKVTPFFPSHVWIVLWNLLWSLSDWEVCPRGRWGKQQQTDRFFPWAARQACIEVTAQLFEGASLIYLLNCLFDFLLIL